MELDDILIAAKNGITNFLESLKPIKDGFEGVDFN
jgi:hypothetical protein